MSLAHSKTTSSDFSSPAWRRTARRRLLAWYRKHARDLPWRRTADPYAIWVSEIMLQQTQVATVERYFAKFLTVFPTIAALAAAPEEQVLRLWEGLGYYRRARQMHAAAKLIMTEHDGVFPSEAEAIRQLPGIGRYTAGAILSIAFDRPAPILEANTVRLLSRLLAFRGNATSSAGQQLLWQAAEDFLPTHGSGQLNQALMELGSLICTPRNPKCADCPLHALCPTHRGNWHDQIPAPRRQPCVEDVHEAAVVVVRGSKVLLRKCGPSERWSGLWDFPRFPLPSSANNRKHIKPRPLVAPQRAAEIIRHVRQLTGVKITQPKHFAALRHSVTRFRIMLECYTGQCLTVGQARIPKSIINRKSEMRWVDPADFEEYPLSVTGRKLARLWGEAVDSIP
jgi:A/G-specific adenine glycosylase